jgi:hypothetical protein
VIEKAAQATGIEQTAGSRNIAPEKINRGGPKFDIDQFSAFSTGVSYFVCRQRL